MMTGWSEYNKPVNEAIDTFVSKDQLVGQDQLYYEFIFLRKPQNMSCPKNIIPSQHLVKLTDNKIRYNRRLMGSCAIRT